MTPDTKYYTPTIEELHVGFKYESFERVTSLVDEWDQGHDEWIKRKVLDINQEQWGGKKPHQAIYHVSINNNYEPNVEWNKHIRVKFLDRQDIEELGWIYVDYQSHGNGDDRWFDVFTFKGGFYNLSSWGHNTELGDNLCDKIFITSFGGEKTIFSGTIKNSNELKILLKQLDIL